MSKDTNNHMKKSKVCEKSKDTNKKCQQKEINTKKKEKLPIKCVTHDVFALMQVKK